MLEKDVGMLDRGIIHEIDEWLHGNFSFVHCRRGDCDMTHFPAWPGGTFAVKVNPCVWYGEGTFS